MLGLQLNQSLHSSASPRVWCSISLLLCSFSIRTSLWSCRLEWQFLHKPMFTVWKHRLHLSAELGVYMDLLPLWWWQYTGMAISWSCCGCNWCCSVASTKVEAMSTTETSPLIGPARGQGTRCRPKHLQPDQVSGVPSDIRCTARGAKLLWWCKTAVYFQETVSFPPPLNDSGFTLTHVVC